MCVIDSILKFRVKDKLFGIDSEQIFQILRVPNITSIPLTDKSFKGVSVIGGKVVSIIDLGELFNSEGVVVGNNASRIISFSYEDSLYAFLVDEVLGITFVEKENYEQSEDENSKIVGFYKENGDIYQVISIDKVLSSIKILEFCPNKLEISKDSNDSVAAIESDNNRKYLFFRVGEELFAMDIDVVKELVFVPEDITPLPEVESFVLGMITLRNKIVNTIDLSDLMGFGKTKINQNSRLAIIQHSSKSIALLVNSIEEVKDIDEKLIEPVPETFKDKKIEAVYKDKEGNIASIISNSFLKGLIHAYYLEEEDLSYTGGNTAKEESCMKEMVVFRIDSEEFAISIDNVQEIIRYSEVTPMPDTPEFVEGVINLRGVVIPIVSLQERLGFERKITNKTKILICNIEDSKIGFLVDDVNEILSVDDEYITSSKSESALFEDIITLEDGERVILKLKVDKLFEKDDLEKLKMINKEEN